MNLSLLTFGLFLAGCSREAQPLRHLPIEVFQTEEEHAGSLTTVGELSVAYVENTFALRRANNKLSTICIAAKRCEGNLEGPTDE